MGKAIAVETPFEIPVTGVHAESGNSKCDCPGRLAGCRLWRGLYWRGARYSARSVGLQDAQEMLAELVDRAANGEEIVIELDGRAAAKLVPLAEAERPLPRRVFGQNFA